MDVVKKNPTSHKKCEVGFWIVRLCLRLLRSVRCRFLSGYLCFLGIRCRLLNGCLCFRCRLCCGDGGNQVGILSGNVLRGRLGFLLSGSFGGRLGGFALRLYTGGYGINLSVAVQILQNDVGNTVAVQIQQNGVLRLGILLCQLLCGNYSGCCGADTENGKSAGACLRCR